MVLLSFAVEVGRSLRGRPARRRRRRLDDFDPEAGVLHVVRQVRLIDSRPVFALPKRSKTRYVPVPSSVWRLVDDHVERFPPHAVTLPWRTPAGEPTTVPLLVTDDEGRPMRRNHFNEGIWAPVRKAAGIERPTRQDGTHALRHFYAQCRMDTAGDRTSRHGGRPASG